MGGPEAVLGPRGPGLSAATLALPKNVCNPQRWSRGSPRQCSRLPFCQQRGRGEREEEEGGAWCPFFSPGLMRAPRHCPKITIALFWSFVHSCWQWLLTKRLDMERIWPQPLTPPSYPPVFFLSSLGGLDEQERKQVRGLHVALDLKRGLRRLMRKRKTERGRRLRLWQRRRETQWARKVRRNRLFSDFFPFLQTDAKADGGELAENGQRRNETVY